MSSWQGYTVLMYYFVSLSNNVWLTLLYPYLFLHIMNDRCIKKQTKNKPAGNQTDCSYSQVLHICNTSLVKVQIHLKSHTKCPSSLIICLISTLILLFIFKACEIVLLALCYPSHVFAYCTDFPSCHILHSSPLISAAGRRSVSKTLLTERVTSTEAEKTKPLYFKTKW